MRATPDVSVVICSRDGAAGVDRCLASLDAQTIRSRIETVVVDDGSADDTSDVGRRHGAVVVRHAVNRGLAAARNSGVRVATAPIVAFLDDDCEAHPEWAERLLGAYADGIVGVGGPIEPGGVEGFVLRYLRRHNPLEPLEIELARGECLAYRLRLYLARQWRRPERRGRRPLYGLVGANMSFRRAALMDVGLFDERFTFGAEELDLCYRLRRRGCETGMVLEPGARVTHHFDESLRDIMRRSRAYGRGAARMYRKWPTMRPTVFPAPVLVPALLLAAVRLPPAAAVAAVAPLVLFPSGLRAAAGGRAEAALDAYVQLAQEAWGNVGFLQGLWAFRGLEREPG
jgi:glycosyltransferase involved in cell wall biosynthesis